jgi:hypothetical protein
MRTEIARSLAHRARRLRLGAGILAAIVLLAAPAWASRVVQVRVGDHPTYTRIVFELDQAAGYRIERVTEGGAETLVVTLAAGSTERAIRPRSKDVDRVVVHPGAEAVAHIELTEPDLRVQEMILANPPRIVLDVMKSETALAAARPKPRPKPAPVKPAPRPVAKKPPPPPEKPVAQTPPPLPVEPALEPEPAPPAPPVEVAEPEPPVEVAEPEPAPPVEVAEPEPAPPVEVAEPEPAPPVEVAEPEPVAPPEPQVAEPAAEPPVEVAEPEPVVPAPDVVGSEVPATAGQPPGEPPLEPVAPGEVAELEPPTPAPPPVEPAPSPPSEPGLLDDPTLLAGVAAVLLGLIALVFVARRRRKLPKDLDVEMTAELDAASGDALSMGEAGLEDARGLFDDDEVDATPGARPAAAPATAAPPAQRGGSIFDDDDDAGAEPVKGDASMDQQVSDLPADRAAGRPPTSSAAPVGGDVAAILAELQRKIGQLESKLEEQVEARERLERQVAAQSEELRVQRAAIARTQRALRSMSRADEDKATEPALRETDTQVKTRANV